MSLILAKKFKFFAIQPEPQILKRLIFKRNSRLKTLRLRIPLIKRLYERSNRLRVNDHLEKLVVLATSNVKRKN